MLLLKKKAPRSMSERQNSRWADAVSIFVFFFPFRFCLWHRRRQNQSFVNHILWLSGFANRGTWGVLLCWPSAPPPSCINPHCYPVAERGRAAAAAPCPAPRLHVGHQSGPSSPRPLSPDVLPKHSREKALNPLQPNTNHPTEQSVWLWGRSGPNICKYYAVQWN